MKRQTNIWFLLSSIDVSKHMYNQGWPRTTIKTAFHKARFDFDFQHQNQIDGIAIGNRKARRQRDIAHRLDGTSTTDQQRYWFLNMYGIEPYKKRESSMKSRQFFTAAIVAAVLSVASTQTTFAAQPPRASDIVIRHDNGGSIISYAKRVSRAKQLNLNVQISGSCQSACTLFLSLPSAQTCITPGASFGFHRAHSASRQANEWGTNYLMKKYPHWVREWIAAKGGLKSGIMRMSYAYASRFVQRCA